MQCLMGTPSCRGVTEGVTLLLLALQTGLLDLQVLQRTFLLSIILFIVVTSTLQSMIEIADPIVLALGASRNRYRGGDAGSSPCVGGSGGEEPVGSHGLLPPWVLAPRFWAQSAPHSGCEVGGCCSRGGTRPR